MKAVEINLDEETLCKLTILMNRNDISIGDFIDLIDGKWKRHEYYDYNYEENNRRESTYNDLDLELDQMMGRKRNYFWDDLDDCPF